MWKMCNIFSSFISGVLEGIVGDQELVQVFIIGDYGVVSPLSPITTSIEIDKCFQCYPQISDVGCQGSIQFGMSGMCTLL